MKSLTYRTTPTPVLDLLPSLIAPKTNRPLEELEIEADELIEVPLIEMESFADPDSKTIDEDPQQKLL